MTEYEFNNVVKYIQEKLLVHKHNYGENLVVHAVHIDYIQDLPSLCKYSEWKEVKKPRVKKEGISQEVQDAFEIFWQAFPGKSKFEYKGKIFPGERTLKANKQVCLKLYNDCIYDMYLTGPGNMSQYKAHEVLLKAMQVQVECIKIESYKSGQNRMQYMKCIEVYLRQKAYETYIGEPFPDEIKQEKVVQTSTDM